MEVILPGQIGLIVPVHGKGTSVRYRTCSDPAPANGGKDCMGESIQIKECVGTSCPGAYSAVTLIFLSYVLKKLRVRGYALSSLLMKTRLVYG